MTEKKYSAAVYTVEAAVLLPLILAVVLALIQICFVLHDRVILREALENAVLYATQEESYVFDRDKTEENLLISKITKEQFSRMKKGAEAVVRMESVNIVPYLALEDRLVTTYRAEREKLFSKEKTMVSEVLLDALDVLQ